MRSTGTILASLALSVSLASMACAASITGAVQGPDGKPFMGAFVVAANPQSKMSVNVLSDAQGHYHINNLPAATYNIGIRAIGYKSDPHGNVTLTGDQKTLSISPCRRLRSPGAIFPPIRAANFCRIPPSTISATRIRSSGLAGSPAIRFRIRWRPRRSTRTAGAPAFNICAT